MSTECDHCGSVNSPDESSCRICGGRLIRLDRPGTTAAPGEHYAGTLAPLAVLTLAILMLAVLALSFR
jgi:hypothetical protein